MDCIFIIFMLLHFTTARKKKLLTESNESIEKFLYWKDCNHGKSEMTSAATTPMVQAQKQMMRENDQCPCPRMCFSMCCDCGNQFMGRQTQLEPLRDFQQSPMQPLSLQPPVKKPIAPFPPITQPRPFPVPKIQMKPPKKLSSGKTKLGQFQLPLKTRRSLGITKEHIRNLLSQDEDVKKILKDLVRVTMQKADLVDLLKVQGNNEFNPQPSAESEEYDYDD